MKTFIPKAADIDRKWFVVDVKGAILGRVAIKIADVLRGKDKPYYSPHLDCGDNVIVINARHVTLTGRKAETKKYYKYSGYPGGMHSRTYAQMIEKQPEKVVEKAVKGMIPHNRLGRKVFKKLHVYADDSHPHRAQNPQALKLG